MVRLHVLGDFYSEGYTQFWQRMMALFPMLCVWGYTHRPPNSRIGRRITWLNQNMPSRWVVRFSVSETMARRYSRHSRATTIWRKPEDTVVPEGHVCPASIEAAVACGTCGLCWAPEMEGKTIVFPGHGMRGGKRKPKDQGALL